MNTIESIDISGFWVNHKISMKFYPDVNFLIGVNGTGKTTVVNLIAAVLSADFDTLDRIEFSRIVVRLKSKDSRAIPSVEVEKSRKTGLTFPSIQYKIKDKHQKSLVRTPLPI